MATMWKDIGESGKGFLSGTLVGLTGLVRGVGENAQANAANNRAIAGANAQAPELIKQQLAAQDAEAARQEKIILYTGAGAAIIIVLFIILLIILKKRKA